MNHLASGAHLRKRTQPPPSPASSSSSAAEPSCKAARTSPPAPGRQERDAPTARLCISTPTRARKRQSTPA
eukprot:15474618-Alexandrium_andersonii.AAC.1